MNEPDVEAKQVEQVATLVVAFNDGGLTPIAYYPTAGDGAAHLVAAGKVFDQVGDNWHTAGLPEMEEIQPGPGGVVRMPSGQDIHFEPTDIVLCYQLDADQRPLYDITMGKPPHPIHLWTAAQLLRAVANFMVGKSLATQEYKLAADERARASVLGEGSGLPDVVKRRFN